MRGTHDRTGSNLVEARVADTTECERLAGLSHGPCLADSRRPGQERHCQPPSIIAPAHGFQFSALVIKTR